MHETIFKKHTKKLPKERESERERRISETGGCEDYSQN